MSVYRTCDGHLGGAQRADAGGDERQQVEGWLAAAETRTGASRTAIVTELARVHGPRGQATRERIDAAADAVAATHQDDSAFRAALAKKDAVNDSAPAHSDMQDDSSDESFRRALARRGAL